MLPILWFRQWKLLTEIKTELVLVGHFFLLPLALLWRLRHRRRPIKIVYDVIEDFPAHFSSYARPFGDLVYPFLAFCENALASMCSGLLTVDSKGGKIENRLKRWNSNTVALWNVPSKSDDPCLLDINQLKDNYSGRKIIAFVGVLMKNKGLHVAIRAASIVNRRHPDSLFLFIGIMQDDRSVIDQLVRMETAENHVRFLEWLPYNKMQAHLAHCHIGCALHQNDSYFDDLSAGNGRKFFAYMQAGLPIVGPEYGEVGRAIEIADCGVLVDTTDADEVAKTITLLLDDPVMARQYGQNGRRAFEENFNWEVESAKFDQFFLRTLDD
jgi:glycosyltransferase involved in cell wall biosynthesis